MSTDTPATRDQSPAAVAARFYPTMPQEPAPPPASAARDGLYEAGAMFAEVHKDDLDDLQDHFQWTPELRADYARDVSTLFEEMTLNGAEARTLHRVAIAAMKSAPTEEQQQEWRRESARLLRTGGPQAEERRLRVAEYLETRPALLRFLVDRGIADHPTVVQTLLGRAYQLPRKK